MLGAVIRELAGLALVAAVGYWLWDRRRYAGSVRAEDERTLRRTDEVFVDPATGRRMRVYFDPRTGRRAYREEGGRDGSGGGRGSG